MASDLVEKVARAQYGADGLWFGDCDEVIKEIWRDQARAAIAVVLRDIDNREDNDLRAYMLVAKIARENGIDLK